RPVVQDLRDVRVRAQVELARLESARDLAHHRRPLRAVLVALEVEAVLDGGGTAVIGLGVGAVGAGGVVAVAELLGAGGEDLVVVVRRQRRSASAVGGAARVLGAGVVRLELLVGQRPVHQARAVDSAVGAASAELVRFEARGRPGPVGGGAADGLDDPGRQVREVLRDAPAAGGGAGVGPRHLVEGGPFEVHVVLAAQARAGLEQHALDARLGQLVGEGATAGARADDDDGLGGVIDRAHACPFVPRPVRPARALLCPAGTAAP